MGKLFLVIIVIAAAFFFMENKSSKSGDKKANAIVRVYNGKKVLEEKKFKLRGNSNYLADKAEVVILEDFDNSLPQKISVNTQLGIGPGRTVGPFTVTHKSGIDIKTKVLLFEKGTIKIYLLVL
jgi:hypothetical protein